MIITDERATVGPLIMIRQQAKLLVPLLPMAVKMMVTITVQQTLHVTYSLYPVVYDLRYIEESVKCHIAIYFILTIQISDPISVIDSVYPVS